MSRRIHEPEDIGQRLVLTPYGRGLVMRTRKSDAIREIELLEWEMASSKRRHPMLYSTLDYSSVRPLLGDDVVCLYGRGRVVALSTADTNTCVVHLSSWRLAGRSLVKCYLSLDAVQVVRKKTLLEMDPYERVQYAQELKTLASQQFSTKQYNPALETYAKAVDAVRYVQHDANSTNTLRADLVVVMITCCNNASTCCAQLSRWEEGFKFAKNALVLLDALYEKRGMRIHTLLNKEGLSDIKLFGEWKVKSLLMMGRAQLERHDYTLAIETLKNAHEVIASFTGEEYTTDASLKQSVIRLHSQDKDIKRLHTTCVQRKKAEKKKEKQRAAAMFGSSHNSNNSNNKSISSPEPAQSHEAASTVETPKQTPIPSPSVPTVSAAIPLSVTREGHQGLDMRDGDDDEGDDNEEFEVFLPEYATKKRVTFSETIDDADDEEEEDMPWYDEHKEAIILSVVAVVGVASFFVSRQRK